MPATPLSGHRLHPQPQPPAHFPHSLIQVSRGFHLRRISNAGRGCANAQHVAATHIRKPLPKWTFVTDFEMTLQLSETNVSPAQLDERDHRSILDVLSRLRKKSKADSKSINSCFASQTRQG